MTVVNNTVVGSKAEPVDKFSTLGRFSWTVLGTACVPCLIRKETELYVCVRIAESTVLRSYLRYFNVEVFTCIALSSSNITRSEEKLLNSINEDHCCLAFGKTPFSVENDLLVKLDDLRMYYNFIEVCFDKLNKSSKSMKTEVLNRCGFIRINRDSVVPFVRKDDLQYVPLFYFEGELETLEPNAISIESWDLAFLKFCCKVHGISHEFYEKDQCQVVTVDCIKTYFPSDTVFEDYWPSQIVNTVKTINNQNGALSWVKKPPAVVIMQPSVPENVSRRAAALTPASEFSNRNVCPVTNASVGKTVPSQSSSTAVRSAPTKSNTNQIDAVKTYSTYRPGVNAVPSATVHHNPSCTNSSVSAQNSPAHLNVSTYSPVKVTRPNTSYTPPTIPTPDSSPQTVPFKPAASTTTKPSSHRIDNILATNQNRTQGSGVSPASKVAPPNVTLVSASMFASAGGTVINSARSTDLNENDIIDLSSPPSSPQSSTNRNPQPPSVYNFRSLFQIPEHVGTKPAAVPPYRTLTIGFNGKHIFTINRVAYDYSDKLVPLLDIINQYFETTLEHLRNTLQNILEIQLYQGNSVQMQILKDHKKCRSLNEEVPLMLFKDLEQYYNSIEYVYNKAKNNAAAESKRQKFN